MDLVLTARSGATTTLTLNRPEKRNALNVALLEQLSAAIKATAGDLTQLVLVVRGAGPVFCSGLDLTEAAQPGSTHASAEAAQDALHTLATTRLITIAAVHGAAVAGGAGLMSACDFALASAETKFGFPEVRRGIVPALILTLLRRQLRERDLREMLLLGKLCDAQHAQAIGLITRVVPDADALDTEVRALISSLLQGGPDAISTTKALIADLWPATLEGDLKRARALHLAARDSAEAREGVAAFHEKRAPRWAPR